MHAKAVGDVGVAHERDTGLGHAGVCQRVSLGEVGVEELFSAAVALMFLFKQNVSGLAWPTAFLIMGTIVVTLSFMTFAVRFTPEVEMDFRVAQEEAIARRRRQQATPLAAEAS